MERKRLVLGLSLVITILALVSIAIALIPPPPANQDLGIYDTVFGEFAEDDCRACHSSGVPDRHHMLVPDEGYNCTDCHPVGPGGGVEVIRDCLECHISTPHHNTTDAEERHCSACHGSFVDDYDDGHDIPTYDKSLVTPDTSFKVENVTTGKKWGGCEACHEANKTTTPVPGPSIMHNNVTHHNLGNVSTNCIWCHFDGGALDIRKCEQCHGINSLHNIQYDYDNTMGELGYGHIGENWDCMGCHGWYEYEAEPPIGPIIPDIDEVNPDELVAGEATVVTITGTNFVNTVGDITYTSGVVVDTGVETLTLTPDSITGSVIVATIPALDAGSYGLYVVKSDMKSRLVPLVVVPPVTIDSATIVGDMVTIIGTGFSEYDPSYDEWIGVTIEHITGKKTATLESTIESWSDGEIKVNCPDATLRDRVTVDALYGSDSAAITSDGPDKPDKTPKPPKPKK